MIKVITKGQPIIMCLYFIVFIIKPTKIDFGIPGP